MMASSDGNKFLMVAYELVVILFSLIFAFPHIPDRILDNEEDTDPQWFSVSTANAFHLAIENLLQSSMVLHVSLRGWWSSQDITLQSVTSTAGLQRLFDMRFNAEDVPMTIRLMFETITAMFDTLLKIPELGTREDMVELFRRRGFVNRNLKRSFAVDSVDEQEGRSVLLQFCSQLATEWLQPYLSDSQRFLLPALACA